MPSRAVIGVDIGMSNRCYLDSDLKPIYHSIKMNTTEFCNL